MKKIVFLLCTLGVLNNIHAQTIDIDAIIGTSGQIVNQLRDKLPLAQEFVQGVVSGRIDALEALRSTLKNQVGNLNFQPYFQILADNVGKLQDILNPLLNDATAKLEIIDDPSIKEKIVSVISTVKTQLPRLNEVAGLIRRVNPDYLRITGDRIDMIINALTELKTNAEKDPRVAQIWSSLQGELSPIVSQLTQVYNTLRGADFDLVGKAIMSVIKLARGQEIEEDESFAMISGANTARAIAPALLNAAKLSVALALKINDKLLAAGITTNLPAQVQNVLKIIHDNASEVVAAVNQFNAYVRDYIGQ